MKFMKALIAVSSVVSLMSGCGAMLDVADPSGTASGLSNDDPNDPNIDRGFDSHKLSDMRASLWVAPNGCEFWVIDDGVEGYLSERVDPATGLPRCR